MAIAFRAGGTATQSAATSISVAKPTGVQTRDVLVAVVHSDTASKVIQTHDGTAWTNDLFLDATSGSTLGILWRAAVEGEASTYTFENSDDSSDNFSVSIAAFSGVDNTKPFSDGWINAATSAAVTTLSGPATERRLKNMMMLAVLGIGSNTTTTGTPTGYTLACDNDGFNPGSEVYYLLAGAAGTEAATAWTISAATTMKTVILPLRPAASGAVAQQGPNSADTAANTDNAGGNAWANPTRIVADDNSRTTARVNGTAGTDFLDVTDFDFAIPSNATVVGVGVRYTQLRTAGGGAGECRDNTVQLIIGGTATGDNKARTDAWLTVELYEDYGDLDDLWGTTPTAAQVNGTDFGVRIAARGVAAGASRDANIDYVEMWVYYNAVVGVGLTEGLLTARRSLVG